MRHRFGIKSVFLLALIFGFALSFLPENAEAQRLRNRNQFYRNYTLSAGVAFQYNTEWGTAGKGSSFIQTYSAGLSGYVFDPRLVSFGLTSSFSNRQSGSSGASESYSIKGLNFTMSFLNAINPNRGVKLWNYVPRPIILRFSYYEGTDFTSFDYGVSTYYTRPGYVRVFRDKKFLSYSEKEEKYEPDLNRNRNNDNNNNKKNRYRVKYQVNNQNGNGDGNGNGNGNANANGNNMNLNRNLNNTGNNANWNKNINRGNRNNNNNNNINLNLQQQQQERERRRFVFKFPMVSLDISKGTYTDTKDSERKWITTTGRLSAAIQNPTVKTKKGTYVSSYNFGYIFYETETKGMIATETRRRDTITISTRHNWSRFSLSNNLTDEKLNGREDINLSSTIGYANMWKILKYRVNAGGSYHKAEDVSSTNYGIGGSVSTALGRGLRVKPTPKLTLETLASLSVGASGGKSKDDPVAKDYGYTISLTQTALSTHFKRATINGHATVSYNKDATALPFRADLTITSVGFRKVSLIGNYIFSKIYPIKEKGSRASHIFRVSMNWRVFSSVQFNGSVTHTITEVQNGHGYKDKTSSADGNVLWRVSRRGKLEFSGRGDFSESSKSYSLSSIYTASIFLRSSLSVSASTSWTEPSGGYTRQMKVSYGWRYRKLLFGADYMHSISGNKNSGSESKNNVLMLKVSRSFGRSFRGR
ncbi:MAG: hypothetical protein HY805_02380 [Nitrospirae bacterium]|nr:hypothetical protein [Nitrospirota bacterium]